MDNESYRSAVAGEIEAVISEGGLPSALREKLRACLAAPGRILSPTRHSPWSLAPILCCRSASGGSWKQSLPLAAAMEVFITATDLLDDLQDDDTEWKANAQNLQLLATFLLLPNVAILRLKEKGVGAEKTVGAFQLFTRLAAQAGVGQFNDIRQESEQAVSLEQALETTALKSASLMQCACQLGALVGSDDEALAQQYGRFGWYLGLFAQLLNDMRDITSERRAKSDLKLGKKTVPLVFALNAPEGDARAERVRAFVATTGDRAVEEREAHQSLKDMGAVHFTWVLAEVQRLLARNILRSISALGYSVDELVALVDKHQRT